MLWVLLPKEAEIDEPEHHLTAYHKHIVGLSVYH